jgi:hypothetical protein
MSKCECSLRQRLVGDGCHICNPSLAAEYAEENVQEVIRLQELLEEIRQKLMLDIPINSSDIPEKIDIVLGYAEAEE